MKATTSLKKPFDFSFLKPKKGSKNSLRNSLFTLVSVAAFLLFWYLGASWLFNIEAERKIEKALTEQLGSNAAK